MGVNETATPRTDAVSAKVAAAATRQQLVDAYSDVLIECCKLERELAAANARAEKAEAEAASWEQQAADEGG